VIWIWHAIREGGQKSRRLLARYGQWSSRGVLGGDGISGQAAPLTAWQETAIGCHDAYECVSDLWRSKNPVELEGTSIGKGSNAFARNIEIDLTMFQVEQRSDASGRRHLIQSSKSILGGCA
jgi:hypothetical protein